MTPEEKQAEWRFSRCPVCESDHITYAFQVCRRRLDECSRCGLLFFNPQPSAAELSRIYSTGYLLGDPGQGYQGAAGLKRASAELLLDLASDYRRLGQEHGSKLLDIGCGSGHLLAVAQSAGFRVTGVDVSRELLDQAAEHAPGAELHLGAIETLGLPNASFDICILADALEHVQNPLSLLKTVWRLLKPGATLVVATPSLESFTSRMMKEKWIEFKTEHLSYFSPSNLHLLLYRSGFSSIRTFPHKKVLNLGYVESHFDRYPSNSVLALMFLKGLHLTPRLLKQRAFTTSGSGMVALATKDTSTPGHLKTLSVIVPVYNEKTYFPILAEQLLNKRIPGLEIEIVIVESNSTDGTREEVLKLEGLPRVKTVFEDVPMGKGHAVREGLKHASGDIILIQDADLEYDLWDYEALVRPLLQLRCSFVLGIRHKGSAFKMRRFIDKAPLAWIINLGHKALTFIFNVLYRQNLKDPFTMFKVFRRDSIKGVEFECDGFDFDIEMVAKIIRRGFRPVEVPVNYVSRSFAEGKKVSFRRDPFR
ncbi:MAG: methyltransferase domain-containing protein, partial [Desulfomonilaceae bacterium]